MYEHQKWKQEEDEEVKPMIQSDKLKFRSFNMTLIIFLTYTHFYWFLDFV